MVERPRLLILDLLESYARERQLRVSLERHHDSGLWHCVLLDEATGQPRLGQGETARAAIRAALEAAGVDASDGSLP